MTSLLETYRNIEMQGQCEYRLIQEKAKAFSPNNTDFQRILKEGIYISSKRWDQKDSYSYEFNFKRLHCFYPMLLKYFPDKEGDGHYDSDELGYYGFLYTDIGFLYPEDEIFAYEKIAENGESQWYLKCVIKHDKFKNYVLGIYSDGIGKAPGEDEIQHLREDMEIIQQYMDYSARMVIDNIRLKYTDGV